MAGRVAAAGHNGWISEGELTENDAKEIEHDAYEAGDQYAGTTAS